MDAWGNADVKLDSCAGWLKAQNIEKTIKFKVAAGMPNFTIGYPVENATVGPEVTIKLATTGLKLAAPEVLHPGEGHFHYFIDGGT